MPRDYYEILGVPRSASEKEVRNAYRRLARQHHPDVNPGNKSAEAQFKEINQAYQVLSNAESRRRYDTIGLRGQRVAQGRSAQAGPSSWFARTTHRGGTTAPGRSGPSTGDPFGAIFEEMFGGRRSGRSGAEDLSGLFEEVPLEVGVTITLEEAYSGAARVISLPADPSVGGKDRRLEVRVPPGVDSGSRLHISAPAGERSPSAGFYLVVTVAAHQRFERKGDDLYTAVAVPMGAAVLGGEVPVPTIRGAAVVLKVPAETQNGRTFRLRGQGMPRLHPGRSGGPVQHGDLFVTVQVRLPTNLSSEERELYARLRDMRPS